MKSEKTCTNNKHDKMRGSVKRHIMKPKLFIAAAVGSLLLAIPVSLALNHYHNQVRSEQKHTQQLQLQLNGVQKNLNLQKNSTDQLQKQNEDLQKKNSDLNSQLQSKAAEKQRLASLAKAQAQTAPVSLSGGNSGNCEAYRGLVSQYNWSVSTAMAVMHAESGCNPTASSPTCDHGLMQINCVHRAAVGGDLSLLNDPATNIKVAFAVYSGAGWSAWTTYTSGAYLRYL